MRRIEGRWTACYANGDKLDQFDSRLRAFDFKGKEVPYRMINWPQVVQLHFDSPMAHSEVTVPPAKPVTEWSLRSRHFVTEKHNSVGCFMIVESVRGNDVDKDNTIRVLYWFPDGYILESTDFEDPRALEYGMKLAHKGD